MGLIYPRARAGWQGLAALNKIIIAALVCGLAVLASGLTVRHHTTEHWPAPKFSFEQMLRGFAAIGEYNAQRLSLDVRAKSYRAEGPYMGYAYTNYFSNSNAVRMDEDDFPKMAYGDGFYYNPVTLAQLALSEYSRDGGPTPMFLKTVNRLLQMQDSRGAFLYDFPFVKYLTGEDYAPGWSSGMAQGQALSALARAYHLTRDKRYLDAGNAALAFIKSPYSAGGPLATMAALDHSLGNYPFVMEYPQDPPAYTLNGFMFAVLGLYDWYALTGSDDAKQLFDGTLQTLIRILPYYDIGGFSAYDLGC